MYSHNLFESSAQALEMASNNMYLSIHIIDRSCVHLIQLSGKEVLKQLLVLIN